MGTFVPKHFQSASALSGGADPDFDMQGEGALVPVTVILEHLKSVPDVVPENVEDRSHGDQRIDKGQSQIKRECRVFLPEKLTAFALDAMGHQESAEPEIQDADAHGDQSDFRNNHRGDLRIGFQTREGFARNDEQRTGPEKQRKHFAFSGPFGGIGKELSGNQRHQGGQSDDEQKRFDNIRHKSQRGVPRYERQQSDQRERYPEIRDDKSADHIGNPSVQERHYHRSRVRGRRDAYEKRRKRKLFFPREMEKIVAAESDSEIRKKQIPVPSLRFQISDFDLKADHIEHDDQQPADQKREFSHIGEDRSQHKGNEDHPRTNQIFQHGIHERSAYRFVGKGNIPSSVRFFQLFHVSIREFSGENVFFSVFRSENREVLLLFRKRLL